MWAHKEGNGSQEGVQCGLTRRAMTHKRVCNVGSQGGQWLTRGCAMWAHKEGNVSQEGVQCGSQGGQCLTRGCAMWAHKEGNGSQEGVQCGLTRRAMAHKRVCNVRSQGGLVLQRCRSACMHVSLDGLMWRDEGLCVAGMQACEELVYVSVTLDVRRDHLVS